jgi:hypothetical protein
MVFSMVNTGHANRLGTRPLQKMLQNYTVTIFGLLILLPLGACESIRGYPDQPPSLPTTLSSLDGATLSALIVEYNATITTAARKQVIRDQIIHSDLTQIDNKFNDFKIELSSQDNQLSLGTDFISLALAGLGATVGSTATKAALAAASAGVIGAKSAIDKDLLYQKTIVTLVAQMEADRKAVLATILTNMHSDISTYPLEAAGSDLQDYYQAGTLVDALQSLTQSAGVSEQNASDQVSQALSGNYSYDDLSSKIENYWRPPGGGFNLTNQAQIKACMTKNSVSGSITLLINNATDATKNVIIACLKI